MLFRSTWATPVARESITLDVYSKTWWEERVDTVTRVVEAVLTEPEEEKKETNVAKPSKNSNDDGAGDLWEPFWTPGVLNRPQSSGCR